MYAALPGRSLLSNIDVSKVSEWLFEPVRIKNPPGTRNTERTDERQVGPGRGINLGSSGDEGVRVLAAAGENVSGVSDFVTRFQGRDIPKLDCER